MKEYDSLSDNEKRNMLASVANLYYNAEMTQNQIAERFFYLAFQDFKNVKRGKTAWNRRDQDFRAMGPQYRAGTGIYEKVLTERREGNLNKRK